MADGTVKEVAVPYDIPDSWEWVRLGNIGCWGSGATPSKSNIKYYEPQSIPWLLTGDLTDGYIIDIPNKISRLALEKTSVKLNPAGSVLIAMYGATIGKLGILTFPATTNQACCACNTLFEVEKFFLFYFLMSERKNFTARAEGGAQPNISKEKIINTLFPLPPLAEQKRIVEQIERALEKVESYSESYNKLQELDKTFPDKLKKSILQYAMQGKLVPQDPNDEPVEVLLEKIRAEKQKLYEEGKLKKKDLAETVVKRGDDNSPYKEVPYSIPKSWKWVRLNDITSYIQRGKSPKYSTIPKYPVIAQKCNQWSGFSIELAKFVSPDTVDSYQEERLLKDGDLMWNSTGLGTLGRLAIYSEVKNPYGWAVADSHVTIIRLLLKFIDYHFIYHFLASPIVQNVIEEQASGSTKQKELATTTVKNYLIPLPPLTEQQRIVSKISQVFSVIESLV